MADTPVIQAAGGVVCRREGSAYMTVLVGNGEPVLWRLPKGMAKSGESLRETAVREVREEAGVLAEVEEKLGVVSWHYEFAGRACLKETTFFLMRYMGDSGEGHDNEYEAVSWLPFPQALNSLHYDSERKILAMAMANLPVHF